jgi:FAD/FMN-containing dehydrogenase
MPIASRLEKLTGFGRSCAGVSQVFRPSGPEDLEALLRARRAAPGSLGLRGAGRSYGDAAMNSGGAVIDTSALDRVEAWDPETGVIDVQPGVTIEGLWRRVLPDGYWPPVCPGTMFATAGGAVSMNIHGKNCYAVGPIGDHVLEIGMVLPTGERVVCGPDENPDLFAGVVAGFGMLGCITRVRLRMKRVRCGSLHVRAIPVASLAEMAHTFEQNASEADYLVGWCDGLAKGEALGRGVVHRGDYVGPGEELGRAKPLRAEAQDLSPRILGVFPRNRAWMGIAALNRRSGMRLVNAAKYLGHRLGRRGPHLWSHVEFHFLLDYFPDWIRGYGSAGLIQVQPFVPRERAVEVFEEILKRAQRRGLPPHLVVFKKHRADRFLLSHGLDGYSLAMDFPARRRAELWALAREIQDLAIDAGGRFYFAKDSTLMPEQVRRFLPEENLRRFRELKQKCDPERLLQTDLARRVWPDLFPVDA